MRCGGSATSRTVAPSTTTSEPSLPTSILVTSNPRSGSRCSSAYPDTWRPKRPKPGADRREAALDHPAQRRQLGGLVVAEGGRRGPPRVHGQPRAAAGEHVERQDVVAGAPVGQRARPARVVADHAADRAARVGRRVGAEAQAVRCGRRLQRRLDRARLDDGGPRRGVEVQHPVEVAAEVQDDAGTDRVARHRGPARRARSAARPGPGRRAGPRAPRRPRAGGRRRPAAPGRARRRWSTGRGSCRRPAPRGRRPAAAPRRPPGRARRGSRRRSSSTVACYMRPC